MGDFRSSSNEILPPTVLALASLYGEGEEKGDNETSRELQMIETVRHQKLNVGELARMLSRGSTRLSDERERKSIIDASGENLEA